TQVKQGLVQYLEAHQGTSTYLFGTDNASTAEPYILSTGKAVMAMGGFLGRDPILTPARLAKLVQEGKIHYFLLPAGSDFGPRGGAGFQVPPSVQREIERRFGGGFGGRFGANSAVTSWVQKNCSVVPSSQYGGAGSNGSVFPG